MKMTQKIFAFLLFSVILGCSSLSNNIPAAKQDLISAKQDVLFVPGIDFNPLHDPKQCLAPSYTEWKDLNDLFKQSGFNLHVACIPAMGSIDELADALEDEIKTKFPASDKKKFHIVAKSMGGLAVRQVLYKYWKKGESLSDQVMTVTTISTPHKGSYIANMLMQDEFCTDPGKFISAVRNFLARDTSLQEKTALQKAGDNLTTYFMEGFNDKVKEADPVIYKSSFSYGSKIDCDADCRSKYGDWPISNFIQMCWHDAIIKNKRLNFGPLSNAENDGLVTIDSARYGTYLGTFEGDHMALTEESFLYKGKPIWHHVFGEVIKNLQKFDVANKN